MSQAMESDVIAMRPDECLDVLQLEAFLADRLPDTRGVLGIRQFSTGAANLTYLLEYEHARYVLRRPPLGPVASGAHDMEREFSILAELSNAFPLAPRVYLFDSGMDVVGAPFFIMEYREGYVINRQLPNEVLSDHSRKKALAWMLIDTLAELHAVDPASVGLGQLGRPDGYAERQLAGWIKRWNNANGDQYAGASDIISRLSSRVPRPQTCALIHNDYKLNNLIVEKENPCIPAALLDWDMCTRGDPLFDLGLLLVYWAEKGDDPESVGAASMPGFADGGFPSREDAIARYAQIAAIDPGEINWYHLFGIFKLMGILQQIFVRYQRGQTRDERFATFDRRIAGLIEKGGGISCRL